MHSFISESLMYTASAAATSVSLTRCGLKRNPHPNLCDFSGGGGMFVKERNLTLEIKLIELTCLEHLERKKTPITCVLCMLGVHPVVRDD